ncbi:hypothetical protein PR202_ga30278 [Eleusine coracana subsp. coracana]|uniref:F-box domain-containing protein n=1 Tax=Eleusine coracana subsp. coracana TaxID=191504 RepID=A0AAV5DNK8_ELECO|nr:hypothetical protein PR202_ga30278 [Eleusine coracana subsp. coracana]
MDDDDLLSEMPIRLSPLPSTLLSASLVCKRWRRLLSDPQFLRRLRAHHRQPPMLGILAYDISTDPVTGGQRRFAIPPDFVTLDARTAALLCDDSKRTFRVVLLRHDDVPEDDGDAQVFASVYESESGVWSSLISASITAPIWPRKASILAGNSLCWWLRGHRSSGILEFDLDTQSLAVIDILVDADVNSYSSFQILRMQGNRIGLAIVTDQSIQLWMRKEGSGGVPRWMLQKTVQLDNLLSLPVESTWLVIMGYDEDGHVIFIWTNIGVFMIQLGSLQFRNLFKTNIINNYHPYTCYYTTVE